MSKFSKVDCVVVGGGSAGTVLAARLTTARPARAAVANAVSQATASGSQPVDRLNNRSGGAELWSSWNSDPAEMS
jgi:choline dehydrogenase-like flavoprotein